MKSHVSSSHLVHPLPFLPLSFLRLSFSVVLYVNLSLSLSPCLVVFFTMHERGWSTCNGKQRASREEKRWRERWPREREGEAGLWGEEKNDVAEGRARSAEWEHAKWSSTIERCGREDDEPERRWKYVEIVDGRTWIENLDFKRWR